ncbi:hypothetical protein OHA04_04750 [Streptomyces sp. NBC_01590]|uniref:hypothetical protein n=1 Tax=Streptomyces sp. NBC_01590 TaxID=2975887 RepID=UPI00386BA3C9
MVAKLPFVRLSPGYVVLAGPGLQLRAAGLHGADDAQVEHRERGDVGTGPPQLRPLPRAADVPGDCFQDVALGQ